MKNRMLIALLDEYRKASKELLDVLSNVLSSQFERIIDAETSDPDCKSIQTIVYHIIRSGYGYANYINTFSNKTGLVYKKDTLNIEDVSLELQMMLDYTEKSFDGIWEMTDDEITALKIKRKWGVTYDVEQLLEHAIVHVLRHRRQVESFLGN